jgi:hypothetical protein
MSARLHWRGRGCSGEPVSKFAHRRHHVCWQARRGAFVASVYLRRDGAWGWFAGRLNSPRIEMDGEVAMCMRPCARGFGLTRRRAQRACLKQMRGMR